MLILIQLASNLAYNTPHFPYTATATYVIGFVAAVTIGSIAWYNSKRPLGWKDKDRPDFIPKVKLDKNSGSGES